MGTGIDDLRSYSGYECDARWPVSIGIWEDTKQLWIASPRHSRAWWGAGASAFGQLSKRSPKTATRPVTNTTGPACRAEATKPAQEHPHIRDARPGKPSHDSARARLHLTHCAEGSRRSMRLFSWASGKT
jgi:hypothetical protein